MSYQPPSSFDGSPNYAQQWAVSYPSIFPQGFAPNAEYATSDQPPPNNSAPTFDLNESRVNANSRIPGPQSHNGPESYFPHSYPFMDPMDSSQFPPVPFPPLPMPPFGIHPVPIASETSDPRSGLPNTHVHASLPPARRSETGMRATSSQSDSNREEGEISDRDGEVSVLHNKDAHISTHVRPTRVRERSSELEEGETSSSGADVSSRRSGSPYNPPLSITADQNAVDPTKSQKGEASNATSNKFKSPTKSLAQLRIQAQGALLSLAPHNIRFHELVAEGIDPATLRQLYEDVGIKISTQPDQAPTSSGAASKLPGVTQANQQSTIISHHAPLSGRLPSNRLAEPTAPVKKSIAAKKPMATADHSVSVPAPSAAQIDASKPMERKDVIARMLAAKAAKASRSKVPDTHLPKHAASPISLKATPGIPPSEVGAKENEPPVREKCKVKTELARQRIEQLKQRALFRSQRQTQQSSLVDIEAGQNAETIEFPVRSDHSPPVIQHHPLPVRPPAPDSNQSARIPGLVMDGNQEVERESLLIPVESSPLPPAAQRKRPRASDFDEPVILPKRHLSQEKTHGGGSDRLVIDISDDESLYADDEGGHMDLDSGQELDPRPITAREAMEPSVRKLLPAITRTSMSTPQASSRHSDQDNIRQKDLEIQALHQRIAEAERRRKAKLSASRTQSPRTVDDSGASMSAGQSSAAEVEITDVTAFQTPVSKVAVAARIPPASLADRPNLIDSFSDSSVRVLASMDMVQLDSIRSKILRMKEIESGLPGLDAEIVSSESRLSACRQEAERLLAEITKGKEGRLLLIEELKRLSDEINGLSLKDLDELRRQAGIKEQYLAAEEAALTLQPAVDAKDIVLADAPVPETGPLAESRVSPESAQNSAINFPTTNDAEDTPQESSLPTTSDSPVSSMDESAGSVGARFEPSEGEDLAATDSGADLDSHHRPVPGSADPTGADALQHPFSECQPSTASNLSKDISVESDISNHQDEHRASREPSAASEAYEPPEPEPNAQSDGSAYSPPFSPAPPDPVESMAASTSSSVLSQADEALTDAPQVSVSNRPPEFQTGVLDNQAPAADSAQRFTPYISPLRYFKAYRFHPRYAGDVSNGYRSLTYSHDIDPMKYFCPYEAAGGVCNDRSCEFQHFRDMTLSDDKILVQMGAVREGNTEEEKDTYLAGLKEIINEMRRDKVKDLSTLATEIAAYRRRFLQDPSRVLPL